MAVAPSAFAEIVFPNCSTSYGLDGRPIITCTKPPPSVPPATKWGDVLGGSKSVLKSQSWSWGSWGSGYLAPQFPGVGSPPPSGSSRPSPSPAQKKALVATRALIVPNEEPPKDVAAYGIVAFTAKPLASEKERYTAFCEAYKSTLLSQQEAGDTPISQQMITFWPVLQRPADQADPDCSTMVETYDLRAGLDAIEDADRQKAYLAQERGPFLIAWSPSKARTEPDAVILVVDMSDLESADSFREVLKAWRQKIIDDPKFWRNGFDLEQVRLAFRDLIDRYGDSLLPFLPK